MRLERIVMIAAGAPVVGGAGALVVGRWAGWPAWATAGQVAMAVGGLIAFLPLLAATIFVALETVGAVGPKRRARARARAARPPRAVARVRASIGRRQ